MSSIYIYGIDRIFCSIEKFWYEFRGLSLWILHWSCISETLAFCINTGFCCLYIYRTVGVFLLLRNFDTNLFGEFWILYGRKWMKQVRIWARMIKDWILILIWFGERCEILLVLLDAMGAEGPLQISTASVVDDVLQHRRSRSIDIVLRKDEEACMVLLSSCF